MPIEWAKFFVACFLLFLVINILTCGDMCNLPTDTMSANTLKMCLERKANE